MFIKYSIGGPITSVMTSIKDNDGAEKREEHHIPNSMDDQMSYIVVCPKCGIQHMILQGELDRACFCGHLIKLRDLS